MEKTTTKGSSENSKHVVWDCGSSLYDSFELKSFEKQLDSAIASRTLSMPHLSDHRRRQPPPPPIKKPASRISRSLNKLIRSVFRPRKSNNNPSPGSGFDQHHKIERFYDRPAALWTISEAPEFDELSQEIGSLVRRTASDRFSSHTSIGIFCA